MFTVSAETLLLKYLKTENKFLHCNAAEKAGNYRGIVLQPGKQEINIAALSCIRENLNLLRHCHTAGKAVSYLWEIVIRSKEHMD